MSTKKTEKERLEKDKELFSSLKTKRQEQIETYWKFAIEYVMPLLNVWGEETWDDNRYDTTATESAEMTGDGMFGNMISPHTHWVAYRTGRDELNDDPEFAKYLKKREKALYEELQRSNFYEVMPEGITICVAMATSSCFIDHDLKKGAAVLSIRHPWEVYITQDRYERVNRVIRYFPLTAEQAANEYEDHKKFSIDLQQAVEDNPQNTFWFCELIEYREDRDKSKVDKLNMPIASRHWEDGGDVYLREDGYITWPIPVWRYSLRTGSAYGFGPSFVAKPKILTANQIKKDLLKANHKAVDPPFQAPKDLRGRVNLNPGGGTWLENANEYVKEMPSMSNLAAGYTELEKEQESIKRTYKTNHFLMLLDDEMKQGTTAREIFERKAEKTTVIGSTLGKFMSEWLIPILERIDQIGVDAGRIPQVPEELFFKMKEKYGDLGRGIQFEFMGPLAQAQKQLVDTQGIVQSLDASSIIISAKPDTIDNLNLDEAIKDIWRTYGQAENLRSDEEVENIRAQRAQLEQMRERLAQAEQMSKQLPALSKAPEAGSLLEQVMP